MRPSLRAARLIRIAIKIAEVGRRGGRACLGMSGATTVPGTPTSADAMQPSSQSPSTWWKLGRPLRLDRPSGDGASFLEFLSAKRTDAGDADGHAGDGSDRVYCQALRRAGWGIVREGILVLFHASMGREVPG